MGSGSDDIMARIAAQNAEMDRLAAEKAQKKM